MSSHDHAHPPERLHGLDALRGVALLLGVVLHAAMAYMPAGVWVAADSRTSPVASATFFAIHLFRMTTFFLIAGFFAHMMLRRRGWLGFVRDRLSRIAGPLVVFWGPMLAAIIAVVLWKVAIDNGGSLPTDGPPPPAMTAQNLPLTHLWFLYLLLIFYAAVLLLRAPFALLDRSGAWGRLVDRLIGAAVGPWTPVLLAAPLALALGLKADWIAWFGVPTPDTGLVPNAAALAGFGTAFLFGFLLDRRRDLLDRIAGLWPLFTVAGLGAGAGALMLAGGPVPVLTPIEDATARAQTAALYAFAVFTASLAAVALSLRFLSGFSALRRYLADSAYWVYIVHLPLVMAAQVWLLGQPWPWWAKFAAVVIGVAAVSLGSYALLVRHSFIGRWLSGRKKPKRGAPLAEAVPAA